MRHRGRRLILVVVALAAACAAPATLPLPLPVPIPHGGVELPPPAGVQGPADKFAYPEYEIRVENWTNRTFDRVVIGFPEMSVDYGRVPAGGFSSYRAVRVIVYASAGAWIRAGRQTLDYGVIDHVGEQSLPPGRHTYRLMIAKDEDGKDSLYQEIGWFSRGTPPVHTPNRYR